MSSSSISSLLGTSADQFLPADFQSPENLLKNLMEKLQPQSSEEKEISAQELQNSLKGYFKSIVSEMNVKDPLKTVEKLAKDISFDKLETAVYGDEKKALESAKQKFHEAKYYLKHTDKTVSISLKARLSDVLDALIAFVESVLSSFGIANFFTPSSTEFQKTEKFQKIMMLVSFFSMSTAILLPLLGVTVAGPIIAGSMLLIALLSIIYPKIAPCPSSLPANAKNWTKECQQGKFERKSMMTGRKVILDEMAATLSSHQKGKPRRHVLLTGESRVGKTDTAKAFVQAVERGEYPELKGKKVFYLNTPHLCKKGDFLEGKDPLEQISEAMGRNRDSIILVLDEVHVAFQGDKNKLLGQKLKSMLDTDGELPYVIGITTSDEFKNNVESDAAFVNRFKSITIESTSPEMTQEIVTQDLLASDPAVIIEPDAIAAMIDKTSCNPQPYSSLLLMQECVKRTGEQQISITSQEIQQREQKKELLASRAVLGNNSENISEKIEILEQEISQYKEQAANEAKELQHMFQNKALLAKAKTRAYKTIAKVSRVEKLSKRSKRRLNEQMLIQHFLQPALEEFLREEGAKKGVQTVIDKELVEQLS